MSEPLYKRYRSSPLSSEPLFEGSFVSLVTQSYLDKVVRCELSGVEALYAFEEIAVPTLPPQHIPLATWVRSRLAKEFWIAIVFRAAYAILAVPVPLLVKEYLDWFRDKKMDVRRGWTLVGLFVLVNLLQVVFNQLSKKAMGYSLAKTNLICKVYEK